MGFHKPTFKKDYPMERKPSPYQYFLDVIGATRIQEVTATGNRDEIIKVHRYYDDLKESEVEWGNEQFVPNRFKPANSYWLVSFDCRGRGFGRKDISYRQLPIIPMIAPKAEIAGSTFDNIAKEGFYLDRSTGQYHLLVKKGTNLWEALKMTGYEYDATKYKQKLFDTFDPAMNADGYIDVNYSFVGGRIYVTWLTKEWPTGKTTEQTDSALKVATLESEVTPPVTEEKAIESQPPVTPKEEVTEQKTEKPVVQGNQKKK